MVPWLYYMYNGKILVRMGTFIITVQCAKPSVDWIIDYQVIFYHSFAIRCSCNGKRYQVSLDSHICNHWLYCQQLTALCAIVKTTAAKVWPCRIKTLLSSMKKTFNFFNQFSAEKLHKIKICSHVPQINSAWQCQMPGKVTRWRSSQAIHWKKLPWRIHSNWSQSRPSAGMVVTKAPFVNSLAKEILILQKYLYGVTSNNRRTHPSQDNVEIWCFIWSYTHLVIPLIETYTIMVCPLKINMEQFM